MRDRHNVHFLSGQRELRRALRQAGDQKTDAPAAERLDSGTPRTEEAPGPEGPQSQETLHAPVSGRASRRRGWLRPAMFALLPLALIGGAVAYMKGGRTMTTDDAYVNTRQVGISTDVAGIVSEVNVIDNQHVVAGQALYSLDARQFRIALDNAKANLALVALNLESLRKNYGQMVSDVAAQQSQVELDQATYERYDRLLAADAIAKLIYDQARFALQTDESKLTALRQQAQAQLALLSGDLNTQLTRLPQYMQAEAQVHEAQRQLDDTVVRAPFSGTVTEVPSIAPGKYLAASTTAFYLVDADHVWIDATPKETELTHVLPGQQAVVTVDTYPDLQWHGTVESVSPAAAQQFSLLPAQNSSGNWVKVVQRVPLRIRMDAGKDHLPVLRAGMSVEVTVDTGHTRGLPKFVTDLLGRAS
ncbi:MAG TPA: HlyD family secretion protein [Rhizomicrobium sp.]|nr:HlyD family secretion protein [Rhizomicrobium sp.]